MNNKLSHAAGIFDVRGCITLNKCYKKNIRYLNIRLACVEEKWSILEYLKETFGGTITNYSSCGGYINSPRKCWVITGKKAKNFIIAIRPFMKNKNRIKKIDFMIKRYNFKQKKELSDIDINLRSIMYKDWENLCQHLKN